MKNHGVCHNFNQQDSLRNITLAFTVIALTGLMAGCGGSSSTASTPTPTPTPAAKTAVQVNMGDAPADWMLAFSMNITSMSLTGSNGNVTAISTATPMEMIHLMGTMQPLAMISAPQGSYTSASISMGAATVMYVDPTTKTLMQKTIAAPAPTAVTFSSPITVGATPMAIGFDMDLSKSVTADTSGNLTMNPVFHVTSGMQGSGSSSDPMNGGIQQMMGTVASVSANSFTMTSMQAAQTFMFSTNSATKFDNTSMSTMGNGMLMNVDANLQSDGSLMATEVRSMMGSGGVMGGGVISVVTGKPATQLTIIMQNGAGTGMMSSTLAAGVMANLDGSTTYLVDQDNMDMSSLPFTPLFDGSNIYPGQSAMPISSTGMSGGSGGMMGGSPMSGTIAASEVELRQQGLSGAVSGAIASGATTSFPLTLPSDSAFGALTGATTVIVYQQPGTTLSAPIAAGGTVHAFGLLFLDAGQWKMVASRIGSN